MGVVMPLFNLSLYNGPRCAWRSEPRAYLDEEDAMQAALSEYERLVEEIDERGPEWALELRDAQGAVSRYSWVDPEGRTLH
jgi:hypothetical protein